MTEKKSDIIVSVCMLTYNHEKFITQAIDGVIMQKVNFQLELVIGEDCGTDKTREICIQYKERYPALIKLNFPQKNIGAQNNFIKTIEQCTGKYIALCEGDDYWTDENKLQKQVDFLESHPDFVFSSHNSAILAHNGKLLYDPPLNQTEFDIIDLIRGHWGIMTASIVFRRNKLHLFDWFNKIKNGDYALQLTLATHGRVHYIPEYMSVYRRHLGGISIQFTPFSASKNMYDLFKFFNKETNNKYTKDVKYKYINLLIDNKKVAKQNHLRKQYWGLSLVCFFSKLGIDLMPLVSKIIN